MPILFSATEFPSIDVEGYNETSPETWDYNCIAWAAQDQDNWWWPDGQINGKHVYWPSGAPKQLSIRAFSRAFRTLGYRVCNDGDLDPGYEKIAIYIDGRGAPSHAARQLPDGMWTHKMGPSIDVTTTLAAVEGPKYGTVARYLRRKIITSSRATSKTPSPVGEAS